MDTTWYIDTVWNWAKVLVMIVILGSGVISITVHLIKDIIKDWKRDK
jgi:hypothetical protein